MTFSALQHLLPSLPDEAKPTAAFVAGAGALLGLILCFAGSRISRSVITLAAVALGAAVGLHLPRRWNLPVGSWSAAVAGALVLGIAGYALHRLWTRGGLGVFLGCLCSVFAWFLLGSGGDWTRVFPEHDTTCLQAAEKFWHALPPNLQIAIPTAALTGFMLGWTLDVFLPRLSICLFYSLLGLALMVVCGTAAATYSQSNLLDQLPQNPKVQLSLLGTTVLLGMLCQWALSPRRKAPQPAKTSGSTDQGAG